jgi:choline dehydrogenase
MAARRFDYILCGSGPGAAAWLRSTLRHAPQSRVLLLERGPYCKTDVLTEPNPFRLLRDSKRVVAGYNHSVMQGSTLGGGTAVNNYAWVTPSYADLGNALGVARHACSEDAVRAFEGMCEELIGPRQPPHLLHQLLTSSLPDDVGLVTNAQIQVSDSNRNKVFLGSPTLNSDGERRSAFTGIIEPLWRQHFRNLQIVTDTAVSRVLFEDCPDGGPPRAAGVETADGDVYSASTVVVAAGALETPAVLMRSGIGPAEHLEERGVPVLVDNPHVGQHLKDKMLLDDMIITDNTTQDFDSSLLIVNRVFEDGCSVQLHRYDKSTVGNSYLALTRLLRGAWQDLFTSGGRSVLAAAQHAYRYVSPKGYSAFCFQTYVKMQGEAEVTLADDEQRSASLDASALFEEVSGREAELKSRVAEIYDEIFSMRDGARIQYQATQPAFTAPGSAVSPHFRMVWHFAGTCRVGDVVDSEDFSVMGVKGLHVADMSACRVTSDGGTMGMAYLTGHVAAAHMLRSAALRDLDLQQQESSESVVAVAAEEEHVDKIAMQLSPHR